MKNFLTKFINYILNNFTLAKFLGGLSTAIIIASIKYYISGSFHIEYSEFYNNIGIAILGWTLNTGIIGFLTEYLNIKGININLKQFIYGYETMNINNEYSDKYTKPKLYCAMDSNEKYNPYKRIDKGKDISENMDPNYYESTVIKDEDTDMKDENTNVKHDYASIREAFLNMKENPIDKKELPDEKRILNEKRITDGKNLLTERKPRNKIVLDSPTPAEPPMVTWSKVFPGLDPNSIILKRTNPGPGFNVPDGEVPIRDDICKHIDYNSHILNQLKKMDLETALEQRNNNLLFIKVLETKFEHAKDTLSKVPRTPTTDYEYKLKNQILRDLEKLSKDKTRAEARTTLLASRIEFIEAQVNKK